MTQMKKVGDLEIDQDMEFQRKEWIAERIGWWLMLLLTLAGLLGLFGQGPISRVTTENGPVQVAYSRFERLGAPAQLEIETDPQMIKNGEVRLHVDESLLKDYTIQRIIPEPDSEELASDHITYVFKVTQSDWPLRVTLNLESNKIGLIQGNIGVEGGPTQPIRQFIYP